MADIRAVGGVCWSLGIEPHVDLPGVWGGGSLPGIATRRELEPGIEPAVQVYFGIPGCELQPRWLPRRLQQPRLRGPRYARCGDHPPRNEPVTERSGRILVGLDEAVGHHVGLPLGGREQRLRGLLRLPSGPVRSTASRLHDSGLRFASGRQGPTVARGCDVPGHRAAAFAVDLRERHRGPALCPALGGADVCDGQRSDQPRLCRRPTDLCGRRERDGLPAG